MKNCADCKHSAYCPDFSRGKIKGCASGVPFVKSCPFCGGTPHISIEKYSAFHFDNIGWDDSVYCAEVKCIICNMRVRSHGTISKESAILNVLKKWDCRGKRDDTVVYGG